MSQSRVELLFTDVPVGQKDIVLSHAHLDGAVGVKAADVIFAIFAVDDPDQAQAEKPTSNAVKDASKTVAELEAEMVELKAASEKEVMEARAAAFVWQRRLAAAEEQLQEAQEQLQTQQAAGLDVRAA